MINIKFFNRKNKATETKSKKLYYTAGNVRLGMGLYRTSKEQEKYIKKSLKKKLP